VPLADELLGSQSIVDLAKCLRKAAPDERWSAVRACAKSFDGLSLSERNAIVRSALLDELPSTYASSAKIVRAALKDPTFSGWMLWPVGEALTFKALSSAREIDVDDGLKLLAQLTTRFSSEFAIRIFLNADLERTIAAAIVWTTNRDEWVRRLASEGTRPRLPWAKSVPALRTRPGAALAILDLLYTDESETVRRSVANHLNDISRFDPDLAVRTASRWLDHPKETTPQLVRHAMRTLIKQAHPGALALMGFSTSDSISIGRPTLENGVVPLGGELVFEAAIVNEGQKEARLVIDYVIHYRKANGQSAPKVFKLSVKTLVPGERVVVQKRHSFKPISTRKHYVGPHGVEIQVNGARSESVAFEVVGSTERFQTATPK
jgi:3-methyladenine DNA glycosylase AlkC